MLAPAQLWLVLIGLILGFLTVAIGAFGAHFLKQRLSSDFLAIFEVGVRYQMYHVFAIFLAAWISTITSGNIATIASVLFLLGIIIFSGSLYALALTGVRKWGMITPMGGLCLLGGWLSLIIAFIARIKS